MRNLSGGPQARQRCGTFGHTPRQAARQDGDGRAGAGAAIKRSNTVAELASVRTAMLDVAYETSGPAQALAVVLLHGFPYDPRAFDEVVPILNAAGLRTIAPYVRGYGGSRFLARDSVRSGQQAALAHDVVDLLDALALERAVLA